MSLRSNNGFTLIELLITLVVLSIGIVGVLRAFETSLFALGSARDQLRADMLIKEKTAEMDSVVAAGLPLSGWTHDGQFDAPYNDFSWESEIIEILASGQEATGSNSLNRIKFTVRRKGSGREYRLITFRSQKP